MQFRYHTNKALILTSQTLYFIFIVFPLFNGHQHSIYALNFVRKLSSCMTIRRVQPLGCFIEHSVKTLNFILATELLIIWYFLFCLIQKGFELIFNFVPICDVLVSVLHLLL